MVVKIEDVMLQVVVNFKEFVENTSRLKQVFVSGSKSF